MAKVLHQILGGVAYLHSLGPVMTPQLLFLARLHALCCLGQRVIHNDLKPDNILCVQELLGMKRYEKGGCKK